MSAASFGIRARVNPCREEEHGDCVGTPFVNALAASGRTLFVAGFFGVVNGAKRLDAAAFDAVTGRPLPWAPSPNNPIRAMVVAGDDVFIGGDFTRIGGRRRAYLAVLDRTRGVAGRWNPRPPAPVTGFAVGTHAVFVAEGGGNLVFDIPENGLVAYDRRTARQLRWHPDPNKDVSTIALFRNQLFVGGSFNSMRTTKRPSLAAINVRTGALEPWNPHLRGTLSASHPTVDALASDGQRLFVGGDFDRINGQQRNYIAAFDLDTGQLANWNPGADADVLAFAGSASSVFAGGYFQEMGGQPHSRLAKIDAATGDVTHATPNVDGSVLALELANDSLFVGGVYEEIDGIERHEIAAIDTKTLALRAWDPGADLPVWALAASGPSIYAGGVFERIGERDRIAFAALDPISAAIQDIDLHFEGEAPAVAALELHGSTLYIGGDFDKVAGIRTGGLAAFDLNSHTTTGWLPRPDRSVNAVVASDDAILAGGAFDTIGDVSQPYFALFRHK